MHYIFRYDAGLQCIVIHTSGKASVPCVEKTLRALLSYPDWEVGGNVLVDCRELTIQHLKTGEIRGISRVIRGQRKALGTGQWALVMKDKVDFGLAKMWEAYTEDKVDLRSQIFTSLFEAKKWLHPGMGQ